VYFPVLLCPNKAVQENTQIKYNSKKQTMQNTAKQNYPGTVTSYDTRPGNKMGLFYNAPEPLLILQQQLQVIV